MNSLRLTKIILSISSMVLVANAFAFDESRDETRYSCGTMTPTLVQVVDSTGTMDVATATDKMVIIGKPANVNSVTVDHPTTSGSCGSKTVSGTQQVDTDFIPSGTSKTYAGTSVMYLDGGNSKPARIPAQEYFAYATASDVPNPGSKYSTVNFWDGSGTTQCWTSDGTNPAVYYIKLCVK